MDRRLLNLRLAIPGFLDFSAHVDDGLPVEIAGPSNHVARYLSILFGENGLDRRNSLPEYKEHYMRSDWSDVVNSGPELDRGAFTPPSQRLERIRGAV